MVILNVILMATDSFIYASTFLSLQCTFHIVRAASLMYLQQIWYTPAKGYLPHPLSCFQISIFFYTKGSDSDPDPEKYHNCWVKFVTVFQIKL